MNKHNNNVGVRRLTYTIETSPLSNSRLYICDWNTIQNDKVGQLYTYIYICFLSWDIRLMKKFNL